MYNNTIKGMMDIDLLVRSLRTNTATSYNSAAQLCVSYVITLSVVDILANANGVMIPHLFWAPVEKFSLFIWRLRIVLYSVSRQAKCIIYFSVEHDPQTRCNFSSPLLNKTMKQTLSNINLLSHLHETLEYYNFNDNLKKVNS